MKTFLLSVQWVFLIYLLALSSSYLLLNLASVLNIRRYLRHRLTDAFMSSFSDFELPISVLVPAFNEEKTIAASVKSLLQLEYSEYEILVINDGSTDNTLTVLREAFDLKPFPEAYRLRLPCKKVRSIYRSLTYPNLRVIDKENGGKADALNAGINAARYPLICSVDADSILQRDSLRRVVQPFLDDPRTVAAGGTVRIVNGSEVKDGYLVRAGLPSSLLVRFQIIEYLRAFLFGRQGWTPINALMVISGAFGLFRKEVVIEAGGYRAGLLGEDMELVVRLHRHLRANKRPYRITFVPDPICWTEAPEDLSTLRRQRVRWQQGLAQSLALNLKLCFNPRGGAVGWLAFPFMVVFEMLGPLIEVGGYIFVIVGWAAGIISPNYAAVFFLLAVGLGMLLSVIALLLEEISFHIYGGGRQILSLFLAGLLENLGYRQLTSCWRLEGLVKWIRGNSQWGEMKRQGAWGSVISNRN